MLLQAAAKVLAKKITGVRRLQPRRFLPRKLQARRPHRLLKLRRVRKLHPRKHLLQRHLARKHESIKKKKKKVNCLQPMFIFSSGTCSKASPCSTPPSSPLSSPASLFSFHLRPRISAPGPKCHLQLPPSTGLPQSLLLADLATLWVWHILHPAFPNGWPLASPNCIFVNQCFFFSNFSTPCVF